MSDEDEKAWAEYAVGGEHGPGPVTYRGAFMAGRASVQAENEKLRQVARASVRRLEKAAQYCGDPQHPLWDGGRVSAEARRRVDGLVEILDPFRPELEDASDEDWDRIYNLDPIDGFVSDYEERMEAERDALRAENADLKEDEQEALAERNAALKQRDALRAQLDGMTTEWGIQPGVFDSAYTVPHPDEESARNWVEVGDKVVRRLVGPWMPVVEGDD